MARGRKALPMSVKLQKGTLRLHRVKDTPQPAEGRTKKQIELTPAAQKAFKTLSAVVNNMGNASPTYSHALSIAAMLWADMEDLAAAVDREGWTLESDTAHGSIQVTANPKVKMLRETQREIRAILVEFGMTPASIQKVGTVKKKNENSFAEFAN
jgi:P27 family predicted phage terminase small subunit